MIQQYFNDSNPRWLGRLAFRNTEEILPGWIVIVQFTEPVNDVQVRSSHSILCVVIIYCTSLGFPSWCPESTRPTDSCFQGTSCENLMMYSRLYQHTRVVLYIYIKSEGILTLICNFAFFTKRSKFLLAPLIIVHILPCFSC